MISGIHFSLNTSLGAAAAIVLGVQLVGSGVVIERLAKALRTTEENGSQESMIERGLLIGLGISTVGAALFMSVLLHWMSTKFGNLPIELAIRCTIPSVVLMTIGAQIVATTLLRGSLELFMPIGETKGNQTTPGVSSDK